MIIVNEDIAKINAFNIEWNFNTLLKQFCNTFFKWINSLTHLKSQCNTFTMPKLEIYDYDKYD
jgi:hypothetical protein